MGRIKQFFKDVGRRRVLSNAALYIIAAWVAIQVADLAIEAGVIRWPLRNAFVAAFLGFPIALILGWFYDITRQGVVRTPPVGADASFDSSLHKRDYLLFAALAGPRPELMFLRCPLCPLKTVRPDYYSFYYINILAQIRPCLGAKIRGFPL